MHARRRTKYHPGLERLEEKQLLSASPSSPSPATLRSGDSGAGRDGPGHRVPGPDGSPPGDASPSVSALAVKPNFGFLVYRLTNPSRFNNKLTPPFGHVLVQSARPVPGQLYNVLYLVLRNGTAQTFDARSGLRVKFPGGHSWFPILTGSEQWKPGQEFIFYVLTKKYYPIRNPVTYGFGFDLGGAKSVAIPGPSGIFLRLKYDPATIDQTLDWIVRFSTGVPGGPAGIRLGMPDTAIYEFVSSKTRRNDFGGYF